MLGVGACRVEIHVGGLGARRLVMHVGGGCLSWVVNFVCVLGRGGEGGMLGIVAGGGAVGEGGGYFFFFF